MMSAFKITSLTRNVIRLAVFQPRNATLIRQYATKIGEPKKKSSTLKLLIIGVRKARFVKLQLITILYLKAAIGGTVGGGYSAYENIGKKKASREELTTKFLDNKPDVPIMRQIINPNDKTGLDIILFQFQTCPFCCKVRSFLDFSGLSYSVVEVDAVLRQSIKWSDSKKVPTMLVRTSDGKYVQLNDSSMIISALSSFLIDPAKNKMEDIVKFYPVSNFTDVYGTVFDIANKYFLMFQDKKPKDSKEVFE